MTAISSVPIELTVVLGRAVMPIHQLLRIGRGAVIELETSADDTVSIFANNVAIAKGDVVIQGDQIAIRIIEDGK